MDRRNVDGAGESQTRQVLTRAREHRRLRAPLSRALRADAKAFAAHRGAPFTFVSSRAEWLNVARLMLTSHDYLGFATYRTRTALYDRGVPVLPRLLGKVGAAIFNMRIGEDVLIEEGVYVNHGHVVIDGATRIGTGSVVTAWTTIVPRPGEELGPTLGPAVFVGTQSAVIGDIRIGQAAQIGAGAVVTSDVGARCVVAGNPARVLAENVPGPLEATRANVESGE
jgi:serine O-acetyltransferase